jgi:thymidylate synthase (FAD)
MNNSKKENKMRIIEPSFKVMSTIPLPLKLIERAGRTCYKSEKNITEHSSIEFAEKMLKSGHHAVLEHSYATVRIICDRGVSHEIVRHRLASYCQESTRYCNYSKEKFGGHITFIKPCFFQNINIQEWQDVYIDEDYKYEAIEEDEELTDNEKHWLLSMANSEFHYHAMIQRGASPQEARSVLPNSLKTEIVMTANAREWMHFFKLRTSPKAHPQMREIAIPMLKEFQQLIPVLFDNINQGE